MKSNRNLWHNLALTGVLLLATGAVRPALAQDPDDLKRSVARISLMDGEVSVRRGDTGEWVAGVINAPLLSDDRISSGQNSRAEIQFDSANILRIGGNAEIHLAQLEAAHYRIEIARGTTTFRMLHASTVAIELNTPSVSVRPAKEGTFRISVSEAGETEVTAREGDVEVFTPKGTQWVYAGQTMMARGSAADPEFQMVNANAPDEWDRWNESRDQAIQSSRSDQYVPAGVYGAGDLDASGTWVNVSPYGNVWHPTAVAAGWAPYHNGRWVWLDYYGWTWVSYDTWGWAPYHYGRWFYEARLGWSWYPGALGVRNYWSPALVGFFGYGTGVGIGVGFGFGNIGWVPLAPYETLHPWWGRAYAGGFNRSINVSSVNITSVYRNARVANGITGLRSEDFAAGRFANMQHVAGGQVQTAGLVTGRMPVNATVASRRFSDRTVANVPRASTNTQFYSRQGNTGGQGTAAAGNTRPAAASQAQSGYHRFGEPASNTAGQNNRPTPAATGTAAGRQGSIQRFGEPAAPSTTRNDRPAAAQNGSGWKSFGTPGSSPATTSRQPYNPPQTRPATGTGQGQTPAANRPAPGNAAPARPAPATSAPHPAPATGGRSSGGHGNAGKGR
jgi:hypothetical protein